ncbi:MAG TPA: PqqD family protein [Thermoanaerobaculia bacterium]|nr:PqqD family protein [Thermoanaerobaculia bacterium]HUM28812.1 PqqD family protein [Thermoanaerobaculia bacterium]HXK69069.1 PqqD family protein [Thermoanaerobaculia bacterium]
MDRGKPALHAQVRYTTVKDEGILIAQDEGEVHIVSEVAAFLLPLLDGSLTVESLIEKVVDAYEVDGGTARNDVTAFLDALETKNLLTYVP